jgi:osmotically-inducible protein OsmY
MLQAINPLITLLFVMVIFPFTGISDVSNTGNRLNVTAGQIDDPKITDEEIKKLIEDELQKDAALRNAQIRVTVKVGHVTLCGEVDQTFKKFTAERIARGTRGVKGIRNVVNVTLIDSSIENLQRKLNVSIQKADELINSNIRVDTFDGKVTIYGSVDSIDQMDQLKRIVAQTGQVNHIVNQVGFSSVKANRMKQISSSELLSIVQVALYAR